MLLLLVGAGLALAGWVLTMFFVKVLDRRWPFETVASVPLVVFAAAIVSAANMLIQGIVWVAVTYAILALGELAIFFLLKWRATPPFLR